MLRYLPDFLRNDQAIQMIMDATGTETGNLNELINDVSAQYYAQTATWGLKFWEKDCGLPVEPALPYADRRAKIFAAKRGSVNCTLGTVSQVIEAFTGIKASCYETDHRAGISMAGESALPRDYPFTIRRKFVFTAGFSAAGEDTWDENHAATLMLNVTQLFRAGMSAAGDQAFELDPDNIYLQGGNPVDKNALRTALTKILPVKMHLIIN